MSDRSRHDNDDNDNERSDEREAGSSSSFPSHSSNSGKKNSGGSIDLVSITSGTTSMPVHHESCTNKVNEPEIPIPPTVQSGCGDDHDTGNRTATIASTGMSTDGNGKEEDRVYLTVLEEDDVLMGRGTGPNKHIGNIKFRNLVKDYYQHYGGFIKSKFKLAQKVVDTIKGRKGRFVRKLSKAEIGQYYRKKKHLHQNHSDSVHDGMEQEGKNKEGKSHSQSSNGGKQGGSAGSITKRGQQSETGGEDAFTSSSSVAVPGELYEVVDDDMAIEKARQGFRFQRKKHAEENYNDLEYDENFGFPTAMSIAQASSTGTEVSTMNGTSASGSRSNDTSSNKSSEQSSAAKKSRYFKEENLPYGQHNEIDDSGHDDNDDHDANRGSVVSKREEQVGPYRYKRPPRSSSPDADANASPDQPSGGTGLEPNRKKSRQDILDIDPVFLRAADEMFRNPSMMLGQSSSLLTTNPFAGAERVDQTSFLSGAANNTAVSTGTVTELQNNLACGTFHFGLHDPHTSNNHPASEPAPAPSIPADVPSTTISSTTAATTSGATKNETTAADLHDSNSSDVDTADPTFASTLLNNGRLVPSDGFGINNNNLISPIHGISPTAGTAAMSSPWISASLSQQQQQLQQQGLALYQQSLPLNLLSAATPASAASCLVSSAPAATSFVPVGGTALSIVPASAGTFVLPNLLRQLPQLVGGGAEGAGQLSSLLQQQQQQQQQQHALASQQLLLPPVSVPAIAAVQRQHQVQHLSQTGSVIVVPQTTATTSTLAPAAALVATTTPPSAVFLQQQHQRFL